MHTKRAAVILAAAADLILAVCLIKAGQGAETEKSISDSIAITNLTEISGTDKLTLDIQIPEISGLGDKKFEEDLNHIIRTQVDSERRKAEKVADEFWRQAEKEDFEPWPYIFFSEYDVKSIDIVLSLKVTAFLYNGGTGMPQTIYYNVDIKKNKLMALSDLFRNEDYKRIVNSVICREMDKDIERYVPPGEFPGVSGNSKFFISDKKLYIAFAKYEVASGTAGEPEFLIPTEVIRGILKKEYADALK